MKRDLTITPEQAEALQARQRTVTQAHMLWQASLDMAVRGHGLRSCKLVGLSGTTLTVEVPDGGVPNA